MKIILCFAIVILYNIGFSQPCRPDTIYLHRFEHGLPIKCSKTALYERIGRHTKILNKKRTSYLFKNSDDSLVVDSVIDYKIIWFKKYSVTYGISNNMARLISMKFLNQKTYLLYDDLMFNSESSYNEFSTIFNCSIDSVSPYLAPFINDKRYNFIPLTWNKAIMTLTLRTNEKKTYYMKLYFYADKLLYMEMDY